MKLLQWLPTSFILTRFHTDNCLLRGKKQILCSLGFYVFPHTNILRRTVKIGFVLGFFKLSSFSTRRSQLSKMETFCDNSSVQPTLPMASHKGSSAHLFMDPTQLIRQSNKVLWHCRDKISHQVLKEILSYQLLALHFQHWSASMSVHPDKSHDQPDNGC